MCENILCPFSSTPQVWRRTLLTKIEKPLLMIKMTRYARQRSLTTCHGMQRRAIWTLTRSLSYARIVSPKAADQMHVVEVLRASRSLGLKIFISTSCEQDDLAWHQATSTGLSTRLSPGCGCAPRLSARVQPEKHKAIHNWSSVQEAMRLDRSFSSHMDPQGRNSRLD